MKVCFETFGCRLNRAEALQQEAEYVAAGWERTVRHDDADLIVVRGCAVTAKAQAECERLVRHIREKYPTTRVLLEGCVESRRGKKETAVGSVAKRLVSKLAGADPMHVEPSDAVTPTRTARAYLKVQDGCSCKCTFCIVPQFRGTSVSVPFGDVLDKARRFIDAGYRELVVTGCNLSLYASEDQRLPELVAALAALDPSGCRIRLGSVSPGGPALEVVHAVAEHANVCNFLHVPLQTASNLLLSEMRRPYDSAAIEQMLGLATKLIPNVGLGCDLMTGFPGEDNLDFVATKGLLARYPFSNAHVFPYSERPDTSAALMRRSVPKPIRSERAHALSAIAAHTRSAFARKFVGKTVETVIEDEKTLGGWTAEYLWCTLPGEIGNASRFNLKRKDKVTFKVVEARHGLLRGMPV